MRRNAAAGAVERGAARAEAEAGDDDAAARRSEGARVWRRRHMAGVVAGGGAVEWEGRRMEMPDAGLPESLPEVVGLVGPAG